MELNITFVIQLAIFLFALGWLSIVLIKPMIAMFEEREKRIGGARREVETMLSSGGEKTGIIEIRLEEARAEALEERQKLRDEGQKIHDSLVESARLEAQKKLELARKDIETATHEAETLLKRESEKLAALVVDRVLSRPGASS